MFPEISSLSWTNDESSHSFCFCDFVYFNGFFKFYMPLSLLYTRFGFCAVCSDIILTNLWLFYFFLRWKPWSLNRQTKNQFQKLTKYDCIGSSAFFKSYWSQGQCMNFDHHHPKMFNNLFGYISLGISASSVKQHIYTFVV